MQQLERSLRNPLTWHAVRPSFNLPGLYSPGAFLLIELLALSGVIAVVGYRW